MASDPRRPCRYKTHLSLPSDLLFPPHYRLAVLSLSASPFSLPLPRLPSLCPAEAEGWIRSPTGPTWHLSPGKTRPIADLLPSLSPFSPARMIPKLGTLLDPLDGTASATDETSPYTGFVRPIQIDRFVLDVTVSGM